MSWVKLDDGFSEHPKIARIGAFGAWLQIQALCYANRNLTDGFLPLDVAEGFVRRGVVMVDEQHRRWELGQACGMQGRDLSEFDWLCLMVEAHVWEDAPGGFRIHDYKDYQPTRDEVLAERARWAKNQRAKRARRESPLESPGDSSVSHRPPVPVPVSPEVSSPDVSPENIQKPLAGMEGGSGGKPDARASARAPRAKPKTPWPDDFTLTDERRQVALLCGLDPAWEWNKFRDHARAHDARYSDWDAAWRNWCRQAPDFRGRGNAAR